jgi:hypothetical protein
MQLKSLGDKEIIAGAYTRKIEKEYNKIMMRNAVVKVDPMNTDNVTIEDMKMNDLMDAKDYLVTTLFGLTKDDLDTISAEDFKILEKETEKIKGDTKPSASSS